MKVYYYPKCGTCRKLLKWLENEGVEASVVDIVESPPSRVELESLVERSGLPLSKWFNTSGLSYRNGGFSERLKTMTRNEALDALAADGKLIKRPIVVYGDKVWVGLTELPL
ncbi:MAG: Spx/MgsR family RNA polymerase-binding regulatory protein [Myxococcales bacterium]|nr:Spx/MgsR family RNA polymerase-binding regulatory protein [Myxococcales bacterium]